jgi:hypothetical protein
MVRAYRWLLWPLPAQGGKEGTSGRENERGLSGLVGDDRGNRRVEQQGRSQGSASHAQYHPRRRCFVRKSPIRAGTTAKHYQQKKAVA